MRRLKNDHKKKKADTEASETVEAEAAEAVKRHFEKQKMKKKKKKDKAEEEEEEEETGTAAGTADVDVDVDVDVDEDVDEDEDEDPAKSPSASPIANANPIPVTPRRIKVIHIGDSYSSGSGFDANDRSWHGPKWCFRNHKAWGERAIERVRESTGLGSHIIDYSNHACHGAFVEHITTSYTQTANCAHGDGDIDYTSKAVWVWNKGITCEHTMRPQIVNVQQDVDVVLMTLGGNDAGFKDIVIACFVPWLPNKKYATCKLAVNHGLRYLNWNYESELITVFEQVTSRMKPGSKLLFNAYPNIATDKDIDEHRLLRELCRVVLVVQKKAIEHVNTMLKKDERGVEIILIDGQVEEFEGHEAETRSFTANPDGWFRELAFVNYGIAQDVLAQLYHPNSLGHIGWGRGIAVELESVIREILAVPAGTQDVQELVNKPVQMAMLVDTSMLSDLKESHLPVWLDQISSISSDHQVAIITFGCHGEGSTLIEQDFTNNVQELTDALNDVDEQVHTNCQSGLLAGLWRTLASESLAWYEDADKSVWVITNRQPMIEVSSDGYIEPEFNRHHDDIIKESNRLNADLTFVWDGSDEDQPEVFEVLSHGTGGEVTRMDRVGKKLEKSIKAPFARIEPPSIGVIGEAVTLDARGSYDPQDKGIAAFHWDFGDGSTAKTKDGLVQHVYESSYNGYVRVDVKTHDGNVSRAWQYVVVNKGGTNSLDLCDPDNQVAVEELGIEVTSGDSVSLKFNGFEQQCDAEEGDDANAGGKGDGRGQSKKKDHKKRKSGLRK